METFFLTFSLTRLPTPRHGTGLRPLQTDSKILKTLCAVWISGCIRYTLWPSLWSQRIRETRNLHILRHCHQYPNLYPHINYLDLHGKASDLSWTRPWHLQSRWLLRRLAHTGFVRICYCHTSNSVSADARVGCSSPLLCPNHPFVPHPSLLEFGFRVWSWKQWSCFGYECVFLVLRCDTRMLREILHLLWEDSLLCIRWFRALCETVLPFRGPISSNGVVSQFNFIDGSGSASSPLSLSIFVFFICIIA